MKKLKKLFVVRNLPKEIDAVLLIIRLVVGTAFILHGWAKIQNPMAWMGPDAPVPGFFQLLAAISEFGGGMALVLGLVTRLAALGIGFTMLVATCTHVFVMGDPFVNNTGGRSFEPPATYLIIAILLIVVGPGRFSLDRKIFGVK